MDPNGYTILMTGFWSGILYLLIPGFFIGSRDREFYLAGFPKCRKIDTGRSGPKHLRYLVVLTRTGPKKSLPVADVLGPKSVARTGPGSSSHKSSDHGPDQHPHNGPDQKYGPGTTGSLMILNNSVKICFRQ